VSTPEVTTVVDWHEAVNAGDVDRLVALSSEDIEVGGPRGSGSGVHLLRDWVARAGIRLEPRRVFSRAGTVVVEQGARWRSPEDGQMTEAQDVASVFLVRDGRVASVIRHPDLASALTAAGLDESDEQRRGE
jgi:ketosteroid isomerase-like protein